MPFALFVALQWKPFGAFVTFACASGAPCLPRIFSSHGFAAWQLTLPITLHWIFPTPATENGVHRAALGAACAPVVTARVAAAIAIVAAAVRTHRAIETSLTRTVGRRRTYASAVPHSRPGLG